MKHASILTAAAALLLWSSPAGADLSRGVQAKMKGKIVISASGLPDTTGDDAATLRALKKAGAAPLAHEKVNGVPTWRFDFIAFMKRKPNAKMVSLDFYRDDKSKAFVAQERLAGIDPSLTLLQSTAELSADDGLEPGKRYIVKLAATVNGKEVVLATTKVQTR
ncbi:MAG TPA: hypothetical protein VKZ63_11635 [Kofleriaceae bacterium]|nr:hypothetical protein [Kofleriaceae bacterium]